MRFTKLQLLEEVRADRKRIADLESELGKWKEGALQAGALVALKDLEVERLRARIRLAVLANDVKDLRPIALYEGGGRESGAGSAAVGTTNTTHAAAEPADPEERD